MPSDGQRTPTGVRFVLAAAVCALFLLPALWTVAASLRPIGQPFPRTIDWLPDEPAWENYRRVFELAPFGRYARNSLLVALAAVPITIAVASMAAFALTQVARHWRLRITALAFATLMVPLSAIWLPRFVLFDEAGLIDSLVALVVPAFAGTTPLYVLLFMWSFLRIPGQVFEAARLDGAGPLRTWIGVALPLSRPTLVAVAVLAFSRYWNSSIEPMLLLRSAEQWTMPLGLRGLYQLDRTNWPLLMAGAVLVAAPVIAVFLLAQRAFLQEFRSSGWLER